MSSVVSAPSYLWPHAGGCGRTFGRWDPEEGRWVIESVPFKEPHSLFLSCFAPALPSTMLCTSYDAEPIGHSVTVLRQLCTIISSPEKSPENVLWTLAEVCVPIVSATVPRPDVPEAGICLVLNSARFRKLKEALNSVDNNDYLTPQGPAHLSLSQLC